MRPTKVGFKRTDPRYRPGNAGRSPTRRLLSWASYLASFILDFSLQLHHSGLRNSDRHLWHVAGRGEDDDGLPGAVPFLWARVLASSSLAKDNGMLGMHAIGQPFISYRTAHVRSGCVSRWESERR